jgi:hypothetical protein
VERRQKPTPSSIEKVLAVTAYTYVGILTGKGIYDAYQYLAAPEQNRAGIEEASQPQETIVRSNNPVVFEQALAIAKKSCRPDRIVRTPLEIEAKSGEYTAKVICEKPQPKNK